MDSEDERDSRPIPTHQSIILPIRKIARELEGRTSAQSTNGVDGRPTAQTEGMKKGLPPKQGTNRNTEQAPLGAAVETKEGTPAQRANEQEKASTACSAKEPDERSPTSAQPRKKARPSSRSTGEREALIPSRPRRRERVGAGLRPKRSRLRSIYNFLFHPNRGAELEAQFARHGNELTRQAGFNLAIAVVVSTILFWPTDPLIFASRPDTLDAFAWTRGGLLVPCGLLALFLGYVPFARDRAPLTVAALASAATAWTAWQLSRAGGLDTPWYYVIYAAIPLMALLLVPVLERLFYTSLMTASWAVAYFASHPEHLDSEDLISVLTYTGFVVIFSTLTGHTIYHLVRRNFFQALRLRAQRTELEAAQQKSERLLLNILPRKVAFRLMEKEQPIASTFEEVSVIFADIVGFTAFSHVLPPVELLSLLDDIFCGFDELADRHGLEKIKTIGDAYMAVCGLPECCANHAEHTADMALDMLELVRQFSLPDGSPVRIRVGIHSGSAVAGVIGMRKFSYDLWGDTVNTASRMESQGLPNRIQISEATQARLGGQYAVEARGAIEIKGKGMMRTYFLEGKVGEEREG